MGKQSVLPLGVIDLMTERGMTDKKNNFAEFKAGN